MALLVGVYGITLMQYVFFWLHIKQLLINWLTIKCINSFYLSIDKNAGYGNAFKILNANSFTLKNKKPSL